MRKIKNFLLIVIAILTSENCTRKANINTSWYEIARKQMVEEQIIARGIKDSNVINAMLKVERHKFVPKEYEKYAYIDGPLPIGEGQTISQPYIVALMTEVLQLKKDDRVLEIGTGSGYQAAILSLIVKEVYTIEIIPSLANTARQRLESLGYKNVYVKCGDGFLGWPEKSPFDGIIITCAAPRVPEPLIEQLAEGGRLVMPEGDEWQVLVLYRKIKGKLEKKELIPVRFVPMKGKIRE
ncbi:MAG: protein-L-isoaspartate(D-aspartate) O-methyltransferase [candidate division WOR-3 bacterium]|nr:protein-L-isoaspartate(D-aspartate) O-methyltransferase [candidate division WOR-3 bacterium]